MFGFGKLNAAVVGTGYMASRMSAVLNSSGTVRPYAVVSRDLDRALQFGREKGFKKAYDSMDKMLDELIRIRDFYKKVVSLFMNFNIRDFRYSFE